MRIIAGSLGGQLFAAPHGAATHPMSQKVRGGLFNVLGDISGLSFLDAFGGSGGLSFEAISRAAARALIIENNHAASNVISANITQLKLASQIKLVHASVGAWLKSRPDDLFDVILADPPYDNLQPDLIYELTTCLTATGIMVLSWPGKHSAPDFNGLQIAAGKNYGDAQLIFYSR